MGLEQIKVELLDFMGSDRAIAEAAWTSSTTGEGKTKKTRQQAINLVKTLAREGHTVPFEHVVMSFWMRIPLFIDRQIVTHRMASHSGMSGRYRTLPSDYFTLPNDVVDIYAKTGLPLVERYNKVCREAIETYQDTMMVLKAMRDTEKLTNDEYKRAREDARGVLPEAMMLERVTTMNLHSFANFMRLRSSEHAQKEIQHVAQCMLEAVERADKVPVALECLKNQGWLLNDSVSKLRNELKQLAIQEGEFSYVYT
jgi:thymidylate synthase (FAD)